VKKLYVIEKTKNSSGISIKCELITHIRFQSSEIMPSGVITQIVIPPFTEPEGSLLYLKSLPSPSFIICWFCYGEQHPPPTHTHTCACMHARAHIHTQAGKPVSCSQLFTGLLSKNESMLIKSSVCVCLSVSPILRTFKTIVRFP
jgi:hypothetical protein